MARLRLLGPARDLAGTAMIEVDGDTVGDVLRVATELFGPAFAQLLATSRIWVNGANAESDQPIAINDEVAVLPPVSGG